MHSTILTSIVSRTASRIKGGLLCSLFAGFLSAISLTQTWAQVPIKVFNTGVDNNGTRLPYGAVEPHYVLLSTPVSNTPKIPYVTSNIPSWSNPDPQHVNWISPDADAFQNYPSGNYVWRITFDLTGLDPASAVLNGGWSVDNAGMDILINGHSTGYTTSDLAFLNGSYSSFTIKTYFQSGLNTLDFVVNNVLGDPLNPTGINVRLSGTANQAATATIRGNLNFQSIVASAAAQNVTFVFRPVSGSSDITQVVSVPATGDFSIPTIPFNIYLLYIKGDKYLAANVNVDARSGNVSGVTPFLHGGDANNDNAVDIADFGVVVAAYGSKARDGTGYYDVRADLNGDTVVDILDFSLLVVNYGIIGDN